MKNIIGIICLLLSSQVVAQHLEKSSLLSVDERGKIHYSAYTEKGDILPDFSYCGYKGGGVSFPVAVNKIILYPDIHSTDDTQRIQQAIDSVASMKADKHGMRGAVLLKRGVLSFGFKPVSKSFWSCVTRRRVSGKWYSTYCYRS